MANTLGNLMFTQVAPDALSAPSTSSYYKYFLADGSTATLSPGTPGTTAGALYKMDYLRNLTLLIGNLQPSAFAYVSNPGTVVVSTAPNNVVDTRAVAAGSVIKNQILEATVRAFLTGTNSTKSILVGLDADLSNALTAVFAAGQVGIVTFKFQFLAANAGNVHQTTSRCDFQQQFAGGGIKRGTASFNLSTTAANAVTQAWVANAADSITIDSISWRLLGNGL